MYIAMNRFRVRPDATEEFEAVWLNREVHLRAMAGFVEFHMLRGPNRDDHRLYASHTVWESEAHFLDWTRSEAFRAAHRSAGARKPLTIGPPEFEGFEVIQTVNRDA